MTFRSLPTPSPSPWWTAAPHLQRSAPLTGQRAVDVAVVGGGLAGLAAAFYLRRELPDAEIALLEADVVGSGATGRSTGIVAPGVGGPITLLRKRYGDSAVAAMFGGSVASVRRTLHLIESEELDCGLERNGQLVCSVSPRQDRALR
ncbi:MAG TPA: FAD-dependent oxidoreductase, partial [Mycobacterium sp.]